MLNIVVFEGHVNVNEAGGSSFVTRDRGTLVDQGETGNIKCLTFGLTVTTLIIVCFMLKVNLTYTG